MSRLIADLHPAFQATAVSILDELNAAIAPSSAKAGSTYRTLAEQKALHDSGASNLLIGLHCFGLAMDVAIFSPDGVYLTDGTHPHYRAFGHIAMRHGCRWGGLFTSPDWDHCEQAGGYSTTRVIAWTRSHTIVLPPIAARRRARRRGLRGE